MVEMESTYEQQHEIEVSERMTLLRLERPDEDNWSGYVYAEHEVGECVECDAMRRLSAEDD